MGTFIRVSIALLLLCAAGCACGSTASSPVHAGADLSYARTLWQVSDGLPEDTVQALAESRDGLLWIGTTGGLTRFDGAHMKAFGVASKQMLAAHSIFCTAIAPDGSLWAGTEGGGLLHIAGDSTEIFTRAQGLTDEFVRSVAIDHLGRVWVGTDDGLFVIAHGRLRRVDGTAAIPALAVHSILEDRSHRLWAGGSRLIAVDIAQEGAEQAQEFRLPGAYSKSRVKKILEGRDGTIWVGTVGGLERLRAGRFEGVEEIHATVRSLLEASDGALWIGTIGDGLWTWREGRLSPMRSAGLLPSDTVLSILEDAQQQIWIGTQAGLVRLNKTPVSVVELPEGGDPDFETISGDARGDVWVAAQRLYRVRGGVASQVTYPELGGSTVRNLFTARNGDLWLGTDGSGAYRRRGSAWTHYTAPRELTNNFIRGFLEASGGDIWIATDEGVSRIGGEGVHQLTEANGLAFFSTRSLIEDRNGSIWIGTDRGLSHWSHGQFAQDAATLGLATEKVWSILEDRSGALWFGTRDHGLFRYRDGVLDRFTVEQGLPSNSIYQILQDRRGVFWLSGPNTVASIPEAEMRAIAPHTDTLLSVTVYAMPFRADGAQMYGGRQPAGWLAPDDSVWFATTRGAARVGEAHPASGMPPRVSIEEILEDGRSVPVSSALKVGSGVARLSFAFTARSLLSQKGVRFRYKLENFDTAWNSPASDRVATYTNLRAGRYKLRVVAFDTARPSEITEVDLEFVKLPAFYQTWWFFTLAACLLGATAALAYRLRVRRIQASFAAVLAERNRMAREMHDTVIQGCTGISTLLEAVASLPADTPAPGNELLDYARLQARATIDEARRAVWNMRHERENDVDLIELLTGVAQQTAREFGTHVDLRHDVTELTVSASAAHEILMTVREAIYNSVQHSGTKEVELAVKTQGEELTLTIADQGCGMPQTAAASPHEGHYGMIGMRERMQRLGGQFELTSSLGHGTRIQLRLRRTVRGVPAGRS
ncbi:Two component regulator propeller [Granulicella rosea]|uniref:Two component regulator propeller n=1 Tax=Granulicella rosea TaxID=474952 RepID=A0A239DU54_9BACT|nr:sensor histidine kinase [Granulicella rosea]SNS35651.1 Two component regulator propeller [Granulicella rosea]